MPYNLKNWTDYSYNGWPVCPYCDKRNNRTDITKQLCEFCGKEYNVSISVLDNMKLFTTRIL